MVGLDQELPRDEQLPSSSANDLGLFRRRSGAALGGLSFEALQMEFTELNRR